MAPLLQRTRKQLLLLPRACTSIAVSVFRKVGWVWRGAAPDHARLWGILESVSKDGWLGCPLIIVRWYVFAVWVSGLCLCVLCLVLCCVPTSAGVRLLVLSHALREACQPPHLGLRVELGLGLCVLLVSKATLQTVIGRFTSKRLPP